jgi:hypothetical protein
MIREGSNILRIGVRKNVGLQAVFAIILNSVANSYQSPTLLISVFFMDSARQGSDLSLTQLMTTFHLINWQLKTPHATAKFCTHPSVHHQRADEK